MSAVFGMCGIHFAGEAITINPHLPAHWKKVTLPFVVRECRLKITLTHESVTVKSEIPLKAPLLIKVGELTYPLISTDELVISTIAARE
jgi:trehalose/maltose hydrolase-like predicted phosphorylase